MAKKVLILSSSPRRGGNSDLLCDRFMAGAQQAGHDVEKIFLRDKKINYCTGCGVCYGGAKPCPQRDDAAEVVGQDDRRGRDRDGYAGLLLYALRADEDPDRPHLCPLYGDGRQGVLLHLTAAEESVEMMERTVECFRGFLDCLDDPEERGVVYGVGAWQAGEIEGMPAMDEAYELGRRV